MTSAPFPGYIFIGRSQDAAWSLTSAGLDQIDTYVETLCGHSRHQYMFRRQVPTHAVLRRRHAPSGNASRSPSTAPSTDRSSATRASTAGSWRCLDKRASYGKDVAATCSSTTTWPTARSTTCTSSSAPPNLTPQTFNSFYMDDKDIGEFTSGLVPIRPSNVDPALPIDGRGNEEWRGFVSSRNHPQGINPPSGQIVNWNNRTQAGYEAPDDNWSLGAVHRVDLLLNNLGHGQPPDAGQVVSAMNAAATQDVREMTFEPVLSKLLHARPGAERRATRRCSRCSTLAPPRRQPAGPDRQRADHRPRRGDHGHRLAAAGQRVGVRPCSGQARRRAGIV